MGIHLGLEMTGIDLWAIIGLDLYTLLAIIGLDLWMLGRCLQELCVAAWLVDWNWVRKGVGRVGTIGSQEGGNSELVGSCLFWHMQFSLLPSWIAAKRMLNVLK